EMTGRRRYSINPDMRMRGPPSRAPGRARRSRLRLSWRREHGRGTTGWSSMPGFTAPGSALLGQHARSVVSLFYAPRTGGAYDSHHRTAGIAGRTLRRRSRVAARGIGLEEDIVSISILFLLSLAVALCNPFSAKAQGEKRITILYDAFGPPSSLKMDWGFAALIEYNGRRILFDTGNNAKIFEHNVNQLNVDLT